MKPYKKIVLKVPFEKEVATADNKIVKKQIKEISLRRVKVSDIKAVAKQHFTNEKEAELFLACRIADMMEEDFDLLDIIDYEEIFWYIQGQSGKNAKKSLQN